MPKDGIKRLATLRWQETSGVDHPANEEEGWVVMKASVPTHGGATEDTTSWDGAAAEKRWRKWASSDGSGDADKINWSKYAKGFAVVTGDGDKFGDYGFLHHDIVDDASVVSRAGMLAAGNAASGARTGTPNTDAQTHLAPHYEQFDMTPPWKQAAAVAGDMDDEELERTLTEMIAKEGEMAYHSPDLIRSVEALSYFLEYAGEDVPEKVLDSVKGTIKELTNYLISRGISRPVGEGATEKHSHTQLADSLNPNVVPKSQVIKFVVKLLKRLGKTAKAAQPSAQDVAKALEAEWPEFVKKVVAVVKSDAPRDERSTQVVAALKELRTAVEKKLQED